MFEIIYFFTYMNRIGHIYVLKLIILHIKCSEVVRAGYTTFIGYAEIPVIDD